MYVTTPTLPLRDDPDPIEEQPEHPEPRRVVTTPTIDQLLRQLAGTPEVL